MWQSRVGTFLKHFDFTADAEWLETVDLKQAINEYRVNHPNEGLPRSIFNRVLDWKLRKQRHRVARHHLNLTDQMIFEIAGAAFGVNHPVEAVEDRVRTEVLLALPGVGLGVASAILTLYLPARYGVIDFRAWDEINEVALGAKSLARNFTIDQYLKYLHKIRGLASKQGIEAQLVDYALWKV